MKDASVHTSIKQNKLSLNKRSEFTEALQKSSRSQVHNNWTAYGFFSCSLRLLVFFFNFFSLMRSFCFRLSWLSVSFRARVQFSYLVSWFIIQSRLRLLDYSSIIIQVPTRWGLYSEVGTLSLLCLPVSKERVGIYCANAVKHFLLRASNVVLDTDIIVLITTSLADHSQYY